MDCFPIYKPRKAGRESIVPCQRPPRIRRQTLSPQRETQRFISNLYRTSCSKRDPYSVGPDALKVPLTQTSSSIVVRDVHLTLPIVFIRKVSIQDISAKNVPAICHDMPELELRGLMGISFLRLFKTTIDYRSLTL